MSYSRQPTLKGIGLASAVAAGSATLVGCGQDVSEDVYCVQQNDQGQYVVVDEDYCDDDNNYYGSGGGYYIYHGSHLGSGHRAGDILTGGSSFRYDDGDARERIGLPRSGKISSGSGFGTKTTYSKGGRGGGFGSHSSHSGGFGG